MGAIRNGHVSFHLAQWMRNINENDDSERVDKGFEREREGEKKSDSLLLIRNVSLFCLFCVSTICAPKNTLVVCHFSKYIHVYVSRSVSVRARIRNKEWKKKQMCIHQTDQQFSPANDDNERQTLKLNEDIFILCSHVCAWCTKN